MKIGVLTHHYVKNYGAFLQAQGLTQTLQQIYPNAEVEIVDYVYWKHWALNILHVLHYRKDTDELKKYINKIRQLRLFSRYEHSLKRSCPAHSAKSIKAKKYDLLVFGSDEIWDREGRGYRPLKYGVGMADAADRMIAYAPSIGKVDGTARLSDELLEGLRNFDALSARDVQTQKMVEQTGIQVPIVLDPTLLYDFDKDLKRENVERLSYRYILIYDCKLNENQIAELQKYAAKQKLEIIGGGDYKSYYTKENICLTPYEWVGLFKNADLVVTGTFHGTVFSVKYRKNFISYPTEKNRIQKASSLLGTLALSERLLQSDCSEDFAQMLHEAVDYSEADRKQQMMYESSIDFLKGTV